MEPPAAEETCSLTDFSNSFTNLETAFFYIGLSTTKQIHERRVAIAAGREPISDSPETPVPCYLIGDVETNGGRVQFVIQLAFVLLDQSYNEIYSYNQYLRPPSDHRYINPHAAKVHGITQDTLTREGIDPEEALSEFFRCVSEVKKRSTGKVIFHNAAFDSRSISATAETIGYTLPFPFTSESCFCTMKESKHRLGLTDKIGRLKAPKNTELHEALVGPIPKNTKLHDALADVRVTSASFVAGARLGWW